MLQKLYTLYNHSTDHFDATAYDAGRRTGTAAAVHMHARQRGCLVGKIFSETLL
jgi:hypothetical protein